MIIEFTVRNFRSFKDETTFSFESNNKNIHPRTHTIPIEGGKRHLYPFSVIYGANASGKSNLCKSVFAFCSFIENSSSLKLDQPIPIYEPFLLDTKTRNAPIVFEIEFIVQSTTYRYTVEFQREKILQEKLIHYPNGREALLFSRNERESVKYGGQFTGEKRSLESQLLPNRLLLSIFGNSKNTILRPVYRFIQQLNVFQEVSPVETTVNIVEDEQFKPWVVKYLTAADLGIQDILIGEHKISKQILESAEDDPEFLVFIQSKRNRLRPFFGHKVFKEGKEEEKLEPFTYGDESTGTQKMYSLAKPIYDALQNGSVLIMDEFHSGMHPLLCEFIVELFTDPSLNPNHAQLLVATHDTTVLDSETLKREQIWFTEKDRFAASELFSLDEFEDKNILRDNASYGRHYLNGRFGAIPSSKPQRVTTEIRNDKKEKK